MKSSWPKKNNLQAGFTLTEILVVSFILVIVGIAIVNFQIDLFSLNKVSSDNIVVQEEARRVLKALTAEARGMSPSNMGAYALAEIGTSTITFYTNTDNDTLQERVRYFLAGTTLKKGVIEPTGTPLTYNTNNEVIREVVHDIANGTTSIFTFFDTNYDGTSPALSEPINLPSIRLIKINLIIDRDPLKLPAPLSMTTQVSMRNLKDNL
jgi:prepilin-type N-terminal cleavage/methylation domain-containing protein